MGFLDFMYEKDSTKKPTPEAVKPTEAPKPVTPLPPVTPLIVGQADPEIAKILEQSITEANLPGFDYIEFRETLIKMAALPMTEEQRYQAAFAAAQAIGATKDVLVNAIDHYLKVLQGKKTEFANFVAGIKGANVTAKEKAIEDIGIKVQQEAAEIERLTQSIQSLRKQQDELNVALTQAKIDIQNKEASFEATWAIIANNLQTDRTKIDSYLK